MVILTHEPLNPETLRQSVEDLNYGGIALFIGTVRHLTNGKITTRVLYTAYEDMARTQMQAIAEEAKKLFHAKVALAHRLGELQPGDIAVITAAACVHREDAFACCRYLIERIKQDVPIWKQEYGPEGTLLKEGEREIAIEDAS
jgi:molybdopterin synthase catalytic subunit